MRLSTLCLWAEPFIKFSPTMGNYSSEFQHSFENIFKALNWQWKPSKCIFDISYLGKLEICEIQIWVVIANIYDSYKMSIYEFLDTLWYINYMKKKFQVMKIHMSTKNCFISQSCLLWVRQTSSNVSPKFRILPHNTRQQGSDYQNHNNMFIVLPSISHQIIKVL